MSPNLKTSEGGCRLGRTLMSERELRRVGILARVKSGELKVADAARMLFVSYRQAKRLWRRYRDEGARWIEAWECGTHLASGQAKEGAGAGPATGAEEVL